MINSEWFSERLTRLRLGKGVSARDMSLLYNSISGLSEKQISHVQQLVDDLLEKYRASFHARAA